MYQLLQGILFCHNRRVLHRDIKSQNVLVSHNEKVVKLTDFGLARKIDVINRPLTPLVVTLFYRSPELILNSNNYGTSIDIWSLGCIFVEMFLKKVPFRGTSDMDVLYSLFTQLGVPKKSDFPGLLDRFNFESLVVENDTKNVIKILQSTVDSNCFNLIMKMFIYNPSKRISAAEAIKDDYFLDFDTSIVPAIKEEEFGFLGDLEYFENNLS